MICTRCPCTGCCCCWCCCCRRWCCCCCCRRWCCCCWCIWRFGRSTIKLSRFKFCKKSLYIVIEFDPGFLTTLVILNFSFMLSLLYLYISVMNFNKKWFSNLIYILMEHSSCLFLMILIKLFNNLVKLWCWYFKFWYKLYLYSSFKSLQIIISSIITSLYR